MLTYRQLDRLNQSIQKVQSARLVEDLTGNEYIELLQVISTVAMLDPELLELNVAWVVTSSSLLCDLHANLPALSDINYLSPADINSFRTHEWRQLQNSISANIKYYEELLNNKERWHRLSRDVETNSDNRIIVLPLSRLP